MVGGVVVRGRIDAVFADPDGGWTVVDWKTGDPPRDGTAAAVQLAAYRLAWAELSGTPVEQVRAAFHYVRQDRTVAPVDLLDAAGLHALVGVDPYRRGLIRSSASRATVSGSCSGTQWLTPGSSTNR